MKLSVIVTCYNQNHNNLIKNCLDSVIDDRVSDTEFILVDDCSTDGSYEILREYEDKYPYIIRTIKNEVNKGAGGARNTGIREARGEYISYIDGDDFVSDGFYYELLKTLDDSYGVDLVGPKYAKTSFDGVFLMDEKSELSNDNQEISVEIKRKMLIKGERSVGRLYKRSMIVENSLWFPENIAFEDSPVTCYWTNLCNSYAHCENATYYYRKTAKSLTTSRLTPKKTEEHYKSQLILVDNGKRLGLYETFQEELDYRLFRRDFEYKLKECVVSFTEEERNEYYLKIRDLFETNTVDLLSNRYIDPATKRQLKRFMENPEKFGKAQAISINRKVKILSTAAKIKHIIFK